jgi:uncharacterized RmlC-like cupin family protein
MLPAKPALQMQVHELVGPKTFQPEKELAGQAGCATVLQPISACVVALVTGAKPGLHTHGSHENVVGFQLG